MKDIDIPSDIYGAVAAADAKRFIAKHPERAVIPDDAQITNMVSEGGPIQSDFSGTLEFNPKPKSTMRERAFDDYGAPEPKFRSPFNS